MFGSPTPSSKPSSGTFTLKCRSDRTRCAIFWKAVCATGEMASSSYTGIMQLCTLCLLSTSKRATWAFWTSFKFLWKPSTSALKTCANST
ncbi:hypothetical protein DYB32_002126 [Aphanomyces invadans]|uniref:Uncharacterized protein n=1 Tax=Aphanomyces invadans TaxID=157072 RepID=A0A418B442_9STRA|nr:hypothetical protein DYB32_002126 [Aphanomyces invadans]